MFYSQFILAKKGPLGTIWIAAHLERKLRKNQVADTDIGVSVDSILFPEVPIALRLSSHLLLGVVRIYSRKVNYLFHDCSEALLKIKQAFRSTAVDLPPEESTAPYHSITLPETFDLDDFELPDNGLFQGNFVDHHISTREQITLQDTMDGMVYSTSQFGPDERFGDGDASQIGLDLDENLLMDKFPSSAQASTPLAQEDELAQEDDEGPRTSCQEEPAFAEMDVDEPHVSELPAGGPHSQAVQTPDLNEVFPSEPIESSTADPDSMDIGHPAPKSLPSDLTESAQAPSTPGLVQEAIPAHFQETGETSHLESEDLDSGKLVTKDTHSGNSNHEAECPLNDKGPGTPISSSIPQSDSSPTSVWVETKSVSLVVENTTGVSAAPDDGCLGRGEELLENSQNAVVCSEAQDLPCVAQSKITTVSQQDLSDVVNCHNDETVSNQDAHEVQATQSVNLVGTEECGSTCHVPEACNLLQSEENLLPAGDMEEGEKNPPSTEAQLSIKQASHAGGESSLEGIPATNMGEQLLEKSSPYKVDEDIPSLDAAAKDSQEENLNCLISSEFPAPETLVSAPSCGPLLPSDLVQSSAEKDVIAEGEKTVDTLDGVSSKKRKLMDSTPDLQNNDSDKLYLDRRMAECTDFIPDDDDILASILVGRRRTPILKVKATPPVEVTSSKRTRMTLKASAPKRKVLLDDTMVMQGDAIRQQLINTEDIRRVRRKAPCTRPEIQMIEKSLLEDEMFMEPLFNSLSAELASLPNQVYDTIENHSLSGDAAAPVQAIVDQVGSLNEVLPGKSDGEIQESHGLDVQSENFPCDIDGSSIACAAQEQTEPHTHTPQVNLPDNAASSDLAVMEIDTQDNGRTCNEVNGDSQINDGSTLCPDSSSTALLPDNIAAKDETVDAEVDVGVSTGEQNDEVLVLAESSSAPIMKDVSVTEDNRGVVSLDEDLLASQEKVKEVELTDVIDNGEVVPVAFPVLEKPVDPSSPDVTIEGGETSEQVMGAKGQEVTDGEAVSLREENEDTNVFPQPNFDNSDVKEEMANHPLNEGDISGSHEADKEITADGEMLATVGDACDFGSILEENDTEFLNVDDEAEPADEVDNSGPNNEVDQFFENSGWSSRTRAVARYLKSLFDNEGGGGRKVVPVDNLLAGKSRKEASRMFFETLVLKTRDYVHVEQEAPFGNISIKPRAKLMKSGF
ncbi:hypothetical protein H6P81_013068 [Aristolochia fimbriata]|uniref:Sister chromatid cohesion 1 protein 4-like n=1 Tax=Aristolochia fimbriata TaxID=158543 RepID=A0AAV7EDL2_ARIFI|nr:hypothetical protein H6P81_013068 [Aristolochia fimbriata]